MPAPNSILTRNRNEFPPLVIARKLYKRTLDACLKMPKRYTYLILQDVIQIAGHILDDVKRANSVYVTNAHEFQIRRDYWISARANLEALSTRIDTFLDIPDTLRYKDEQSGRMKGITISELEEIADLICQERGLVSKTLESEKERYQNLLQI